MKEPVICGVEVAIQRVLSGKPLFWRSDSSQSFMRFVPTHKAMTLGEFLSSEWAYGPEDDEFVFCTVGQALDAFLEDKEVYRRTRAFKAEFCRCNWTTFNLPEVIRDSEFAIRKSAAELTREAAEAVRQSGGVPMPEMAEQLPFEKVFDVLYEIESKVREALLEVEAEKARHQ